MSAVSSDVLASDSPPTIWSSWATIASTPGRSAMFAPTYANRTRPSLSMMYVAGLDRSLRMPSRSTAFSSTSSTTGKRDRQARVVEASARVLEEPVELFAVFARFDRIDRNDLCAPFGDLVVAGDQSGHLCRTVGADRSRIAPGDHQDHVAVAGQFRHRCLVSVGVDEDKLGQFRLGGCVRCRLIKELDLAGTVVRPVSAVPAVSVTAVRLGGGFAIGRRGNRSRRILAGATGQQDQQRQQRSPESTAGRASGRGDHVRHHVRGGRDRGGHARLLRSATCRQ